MLDNQALVYHIVRRLMKTCEPVRRLGLEEAVQVGLLGLVKAAKHYDPTRAKFVTLAYAIIRREVLHEANAWDTIRLPHNMDIPQRQAKAQKCMPISNDYDFTAPSDPLELDLDMDVELLEAALQHLEYLNPTHHYIFCRVHGLIEDRIPVTFAALARERGISPERIRQVVNTAMLVIREYLAG